MNPTNRLIHRPWWLDQFHYNPFKHLLRITQQFFDIGTTPSYNDLYLRHNLTKPTTLIKPQIKSILRYTNNHITIQAHPDIEEWLLKHKHDLRVDRNQYYNQIYIQFRTQELMALYLLTFPTLNRLPDYSDS